MNPVGTLRKPRYVSDEQPDVDEQRDRRERGRRAGATRDVAARRRRRAPRLNSRKNQPSSEVDHRVEPVLLRRAAA